MSVDRFDGGPRSVIVVGAGIVGLSTAWFLQERGVEVTVVDRTGIAAGASAGNAGWIAPALTLPLNKPAVLRYAMKSLFDSTRALHIPMTADVGRAAFLLRFAAQCRNSSWKRAVRGNAPLNEEALEAFDVLTDNGVDVPVTNSPITALFRTERDAERLLHELRQLEEFGGADVSVTALSGPALRDQVPLASPAIGAGLNIHGQRFVDPERFVRALGRAVVARGARFRMMEVTDVLPARRGGIAVYSRRRPRLIADAAVIATGAWLPVLTSRRLNTRVQAGRGYSFTVPVDRPIPAPIYLPDIRVACTPLQGALRVAGTMEFRRPDAPIVPERVDAIIASTRPLLDGVRWDERSDVWVGPRPVASDSRPLIGEVAQDIYVAGGHGMWGLTQGPVTGRLLTEQITTGKQSEVLREFDPMR
ncbi:FAD-dependent oxidoreductase [Antrihabitans stalactiti]|uniref:FAD-binding oxidoreductase n=1 Tax=Antrihabitans stalactiti TaxID=2584121 RepID=A0A848KQ92_9NOCA|nr:FAD-binding oxidoreductase [Antrihabitans stalactiti]